MTLTRARALPFRVHLFLSFPFTAGKLYKCINEIDTAEEARGARENFTNRETENNDLGTKPGQRIQLLVSHRERFDRSFFTLLIDT